MGMREAQLLRRVVQEFGQATKAQTDQPQARSMPALIATENKPWD